MPAEQDGKEPIEDDELLYRRVPTVHYSSGLSPEAFAPHKTNDTDGLSLTRAKYNSLDDAAKGRPGKEYYVAVFRASDLRDIVNVQIEPDPQPHDSGHVLIPEMNSDNRKAQETAERKLAMKVVCLRIEGPFATPDDAQ